MKALSAQWSTLKKVKEVQPRHPPPQHQLLQHQPLAIDLDQDLDPLANRVPVSEAEGGESPVRRLDLEEEEEVEVDAAPEDQGVNQSMNFISDSEDTALELPLGAKVWGGSARAGSEGMEQGMDGLFQDMRIG